MRSDCIVPLLLSTLAWAQAAAPSSGAEAIRVDHDGLAAAAAVIESAVDADEIRGAVVLVSVGGVAVLHEAYGHRDLDGELPMATDSLFRMASNTKAVTAAAVLSLVDAGKIDLDAPIKRWFPSFDHGQTAKVTVRQLLTHTSGLRIPTLFLQPVLERSDEHPSAPSLVLEVARFGEVGAEVEPGTSYAYNNPGYNTLAGLVEVVGGQGFEDYCRERFYAPLGMRDTCNHESRADHARMSAVFKKRGDGTWRAGWQPGDDPDLPFVRGSGGMVSTAEDFAKFCRMLLDGGVFDGRRLLSAESVAAATRSQTGQIEGVDYGFGWAIGAAGTYSHGGSDGTWAWCDPGRDLVGIVFTQTQDRAVSKVRREFRQRVERACARRGR